ncbi:MAG: ADP-ribosylglycohydrolase family protein [Steroidobacteraceae bacterium]
MEAAPPLPNTYWALPGLLLAGEHPAGLTPEATRQRLGVLLAAGIECFLDLTHPSEIEPYDHTLPFQIEYLRKPIRDHGLPEKREHMMEILDCLHDALRSSRPAYVHCRAGIGRTGMVIGCLLVERGFTGEQALDELARLWERCERAKLWPSVPETDAQTDYVLHWSPRKLPFEVAVPAAQPRSSGPDSLLDPATLAAARSLRQRFLGALLGLAAGDAAAAATQYRRPGSFAPVGDLIGGGPFALPRGGWSDDTAMALCLADSLLAANGFDARDQVERYQRWQREGYLSATGQCLGITASTARALAMAQWRRQLFSGSHAPDQLDPEPLSRVVPVVMFFFAAPEQAVQLASEAARTTCQAPAVLAACRDLARALHPALSGEAKPRILAEVSSGADARSAPARNGTVTEALAIALEAFAATDTFRDAVLHAANHGGNSDVAGAVCGQLAGAFYGAGAIPAVWRDALLQRDIIECYADRLLQHAVLEMR